MTESTSEPRQADPADLLRHLDEVGAQCGVNGTPGQTALGVIQGMVARQAMVLSYIDNFRMLAFLCFLCVPAVFLFKRVRAKKGPVAMH